MPARQANTAHRTAQNHRKTAQENCCFLRCFCAHKGRKFSPLFSPQEGCISFIVVMCSEKNALLFIRDLTRFQAIKRTLIVQISPSAPERKSCNLNGSRVFLLPFDANLTQTSVPRILSAAFSFIEKTPGSLLLQLTNRNSNFTSSIRHSRRLVQKLPVQNAGRPFCLP